jgi:hypothetical protein
MFRTHTRGAGVNWPADLRISNNHIIIDSDSVVSSRVWVCHYYYPLTLTSHSHPQHSKGNLPAYAHTAQNQLVVSCMCPPIVVHNQAEQISATYILTGGIFPVGIGGVFFP